MSEQHASRRPWITRGVVGIVLATFFSDVAHEAATAVLPLYLVSVGLGPAALGAVEGFADLVYSLSKLGGGMLGARLARKRPVVAAGYALTMVGTASMALVQGVTAMMSLRAGAWVGRGVRSPLRDYMLADEVEPTHFGRAYGLERAADMLGALVGPLLAILLVYFGLSAREVIGWTVVPALIPVLAILFLTRDRHVIVETRPVGARTALPPDFKRFLGPVLLFGLGDFSRTFLILLAAQALGDAGHSAPATLSIAVLLYALHNGVSALAAYPIGKLGDRMPRTRLLSCGYALGVVTNLVLAFGSNSMFVLSIAVVMSGVYIAAEETLEKASCAALLPRESRSLGLGILASANAVGDMISSVGIGLLLQAGRPALGFSLAAGAGALGTMWMFHFARTQAAKDRTASGV
ncbi:MAG: MFS transporter [Planctomycetes bacterium]|nr:MFS transporter [Planctomycetota bacterium]